MEVQHCQKLHDGWHPLRSLEHEVVVEQEEIVLMNDRVAVVVVV